MSENKKQNIIAESKEFISNKAEQQQQQTLTNTINQIDTNMNQYNYDLGTIAKQIFDAHSRTFLSYFDFNEMNRIINQQQQVIIDSNNNNNTILPIINGSSNNSPSSSTNSSSSSSNNNNNNNEIQRILNLVI